MMTRGWFISRLDQHFNMLGLWGFKVLIPQDSLRFFIIPGDLGLGEQ